MSHYMTYYFSPLCPIESYVLVQFDFIRKFCLERFQFGRLWINVSEHVKGKKKFRAKINTVVNQTNREEERLVDHRQYSCR